MSIFDTFKKNIMIFAGIKNGIVDHAKKLKKYKHLKKCDLPSIPDDEIRTAVMSWVCGKFNKECSNQNEIIESLPKPCRDVYTSCSIVDEVNNGGLNQLFFNSTGQFAQMAQEGFHALGNEELAGVMKTAIEVYRKNKELFDKYDDGTVESFSQSYNEKLFDALDDCFYKEEPGFESLLVTYIRNNENAFGD